MTRPFPAALALLSLIAQPVVADQSITVNSSKYLTPVVELYTSEGCSSCPPADRWLSQLVDIPPSELNVLALAFHVDYWDYIGWKDEFANPEYTARQRRLGNQNRQSTIYTPEFFVDGKEARGTGRILEKIQLANTTPARVDLAMSVQAEASTYRLNLTSDNRSGQPLKVQFIVFEDNLSNQVERGENAGRLLQHQRVVRYLSEPVALEKSVMLNIDRNPHWKTGDIGIAAVVVNNKDAYMQSVYLRPEP